MIIDKNFSQLMEKGFHGKSFTNEEITALIQGMVDDTLSDIRVASIFTALRFVSLTPENIIAIIEWCREKTLVLNPALFPNIVDCGGTGGEPPQKVNISTMASIVAASSGAHVVKLTGKSLSSKSGSSNLLKFFKIAAAFEESDVENQLTQTGIACVNAASYYPVLKNVSDIRRTLGFKTIIDLIFPLANPIALSGQLVGVYDTHVMPLMVSCLKMLGRKRALVVHGEGGLDEISVCGPTHVSKLENGVIAQETWTPEKFGFNTYSMSELHSSHLENNAHIFTQVLQNKASMAIMSAVEINAAALLWCAQKCDSIPDGLVLVREALKTGKAWKTFEQWKKD